MLRCTWPELWATSLVASSLFGRVRAVSVAAFLRFKVQGVQALMKTPAWEGNYKVRHTFFRAAYFGVWHGADIGMVHPD